MLLPRLLLTVLVWWLAVVAEPARAGHACDRVELLEQAQRTVTQDGRLIEERVVNRLDSLPREWRNERTHIRYRIYLDPCPGMGNRSLWIYRIGAPYRAWLDGRPLIAIDPAALVARPAAQVYNGRVPALFMLPPEARRLDIELATVPYIGNGLVRLATGPQEAMLEMRVVNSGVIARLYDIANYVVGIVGLLSLLVWRMRMRDRTVLWFGLACVTWAFRGWAYQVFVYPLPALVMEQLNPWLVLTTLCCVTASILHSVGQASVRRLRWLGYAWLLPTLGMASTALLGTGSVPIRMVSFATAFFLICYALVRLVHSWRLNRKIGHALMGAGLVVLIAGSVHDLGLVFGWVPPDRWVLITPAFTVLLLAHTVAVSIYLGQSLNRAELANEELERNIAAKSRELEHSYALLRESERASARAQERARFNREIHDGLGAQLITALRGVERDALSKDQVVQTLQEGLDELRLLMDSSDLGRSLHGALVAWRSRWDARLQAIGLHLHWSVADDLDGLELSSDATLQVMRVLQESVTNTLKHAGARHISIWAWREPGPVDALRLEIQDDGKGLPEQPAAASGRGLRHMVQRAERLGARLVVANAPAPQRGVLVSLSLPLREGDFPSSDAAPLMA